MLVPLFEARKVAGSAKYKQCMKLCCPLRSFNENERELIYLLYSGIKMLNNTADLSKNYIVHL